MGQGLGTKGCLGANYRKITVPKWNHGVHLGSVFVTLLRPGANIGQPRGISFGSLYGSVRIHEFLCIRTQVCTKIAGLGRNMVDKGSNSMWQCL